MGKFDSLIHFSKFLPEQVSDMMRVAKLKRWGWAGEIFTEHSLDLPDCPREESSHYFAAVEGQAR